MQIYNQIMELKNEKIIVLQKIMRGYFIRNNIIIPNANLQTKNWRKNQKWYKNGKSNECEKYQLQQIAKIIGTQLPKTYDRIQMENNDIICNKNPLMNEDGYEWTETFDGKLLQNNNTYYFNLKFICDFGGSQTRTLREVYNFVKCQLEFLIKHNTTNIIFVNILDGDTCYYNKNKFEYLQNKEKYKFAKKCIFIGSMYDFQKNKRIIFG